MVATDLNPNSTGKIRCENCDTNFDDGDVGLLGERCPACRQGVVEEGN